MRNEDREVAADAAVIKAAHVRSSGSAGVAVRQGPSTRVEFARHEGVVRAIHIHCRCGETTTVHCEYDEGGESS